MAEIIPYLALPVSIVAAVAVILFLIFGLPALTRRNLQKTGVLAEAVIQDLRYGRGTVYSGDEYNHTVTAQKVILTLEVHPAGGQAYTAEDAFMAKASDLMRLRSGVSIQVRVDKNNPRRVACLPETASAGADAPFAARANAAIADVLARGTAVNADEVLKAMQSRGITARPMPGGADDPKAKLEKLRTMQQAGLITAEEYETKKGEILAKM